MYEVIQMDATSWRIEENGVRSFLMAGAAQALLVDTGYGSGDLRQTVSGLTDLPIMLVNTHADGDHIGCNHLFPPALMHPAEFDRYAQKKRESAPTPVALWEGAVIDLQNRRLEVILIPGHTPGSIALLDRERRALYSGDSVQDGRVYMFGPGRNMPAYIASMERLLARAGEFDTIHPSHGSASLGVDVLTPLIEGARKVLRGEIAGEPVDMRDVRAMQYDVGVASFLCD